MFQERERSWFGRRGRSVASVSRSSASASCCIRATAVWLHVGWQSGQSVASHFGRNRRYAASSLPGRQPPTLPLRTAGGGMKAHCTVQLTMRSSGLRGHIIVFPAVLSARSRLTRRWMLGQGSVGESSSPDCSRGLKRSGPGQQSISGSRLAYLASRFFPGKDQEAQSHSRRFGQAASQITSAHICSLASSLGSELPKSWLRSDSRLPERRFEGAWHNQSGSVSVSKITCSVGRPHPTRRSSGLRGESIVFPAVLSARSRLTRR
jgi:hypothetical protein